VGIPTAEWRKRKRKMFYASTPSRGMGGWQKGHLIPRDNLNYFNDTQTCIAGSYCTSAGMKLRIS